MSQIPHYSTENKSVVSLVSYMEYAWMNRLWRWADENMIEKRHLPRDKESLLKLKRLKLTHPSYYDKEEKEELGQSSKSIEEFIKERQKEILQEIYNMAQLSKAVEDYEASKDPTEIFKYISSISYLPPELGSLSDLEELCISWNPIQRLPDEITSLKNLKKLCLCHNPFLVLTEKQKAWVNELDAGGAEVSHDEGLLDEAAKHF